MLNSVCFSPERNESLASLSKQKSPVKIKRFSINRKYGRDDVVINKNTAIIPTTVSFAPAPAEKEDAITLDGLKQLRPEQLVCIKGKVLQLSSTKTVVLQGSNVKKQEGYIADPTGYSKIVFWGSHADSTEENSTYIFNKVRVKVFQNQIYLNTPKQDDECVITSCDAFPQPVHPIEDQPSTKQAVGSIEGVFSINKYRSCCMCSKKVVEKPNISYCEHCKLSQKTSKCNTNWFLKVYFESSNQPKEKLRLLIYNDVATKLFSLCNLEPEPSNDEVMQGVLQMTDIKVFFDMQSKKIIDIEPLNI